MELDFVFGWCWNKLHFAFSELSRKIVLKLKLVEAVLRLMHVTRFERATANNTTRCHLKLHRGYFARDEKNIVYECIKMWLKNVKF